jgi:hypothetical protein
MLDTECRIRLKFFGLLLQAIPDVFQILDFGLCGASQPALRDGGVMQSRNMLCLWPRK